MERRFTKPFKKFFARFRKARGRKIRGGIRFGLSIDIAELTLKTNTEVRIFARIMRLRVGENALFGTFLHGSWNFSAP